MLLTLLLTLTLVLKEWDGVGFMRINITARTDIDIDIVNEYDD